MPPPEGAEEELQLAGAHVGSSAARGALPAAASPENVLPIGAASGGRDNGPGAGAAALPSARLAAPLDGLRGLCDGERPRATPLRELGALSAAGAGPGQPPSVPRGSGLCTLGAAVTAACEEAESPLPLQPPGRTVREAAPSSPAILDFRVL
mmetsp:Transcript_22019/g.46860  ORF Transcript_22019/g.46860 Transcript_22019/m.46860 type:complete len:152 (+) Transcript_22019:1627-2082(+)